MWIKQHAKYYKLKSYYDMRLWKIRIQNNAKVRSPRDSALYLLLLASLITLKKYYTFDEGVN